MMSGSWKLAGCGSIVAAMGTCARPSGPWHAVQFCWNICAPSFRSGGVRGLRARPPASTRSSTSSPQSRLTPSGSSALSTRALISFRRGRNASPRGPSSPAASVASAMKLRCSASSKSDFDSTAIG